MTGTKSLIINQQRKILKINETFFTQKLADIKKVTTFAPAIRK